MELDFVDEKREQARVRAESYKQKVQRAFNKRVLPCTFQIGDLVLRERNPAGEPSKLAPKWEGPYKITKRVAGSAYYLQDVESHDLPRPWNAMHIRRYYC